MSAPIRSSPTPFAVGGPEHSFGPRSLQPSEPARSALSTERPYRHKSHSIQRPSPIVPTDVAYVPPGPWHTRPVTAAFTSVGFICEPSRPRASRKILFGLV